jgi:hypothetical protein
MNRFSKAILIFLICTSPAILLDSCRVKGPHNKYRDAKVRVSEREIAQNKKILKKGDRAYKKQERRNRRYLYGKGKAK